MANKILLLEDDMSLIDGLQYSLKKNGYAINPPLYADSCFMKRCSTDS